MGGEAQLRFDHERNIVYITLEGLVSEQMLLAGFDAAVSARDYKPGMARLWDFRKADSSNLDPASFGLIAQHSADSPPGVRDVKAAFVTAQPAEFGLARMFQAHAENIAAATLRVFDDLGEAETWLTEDATE